MKTKINMNKRKHLKTILILGISPILLCSFLLVNVFSIKEQESPNSSRLYARTNFYRINPSTILNDIRSGQEDIFLPENIENGVVFPDVPSGSIPWTSKDYLMVADSHLFYLTGEMVSNNWEIYGIGKFRVEQCQDDMRFFDSAEITFFKREPTSFPVSYIEIRPLSTLVESAMTDYERVKQTTVLNKWLVDPDKAFPVSDALASSMTAEDALGIAENAGGKEMRQMLFNDGCSLSATYFYDKWIVRYRWSTPSLRYTYEFYINSNDGSYKTKEDLDRCIQSSCP